MAWEKPEDVELRTRPVGGAKWAWDMERRSLVERAGLAEAAAERWRTQAELWRIYTPAVVALSALAGFLLGGLLWRS